MSYRIPPPKFGFSMSEAMEALGIGSRKTLYDLIHSGQLETYCIGRRRYTTGPAIVKLQKQKTQESKARPIVGTGRKR